MSKKKTNKKKKDSTNQIEEAFGNGHNVLLIMADEFRFPIHKDAGGMKKDLKNILGFQNLDNSKDNSEEYISEEARKLFPGFMKLRDNSTVLKNHTVATTACVPSRAALFTGQYGALNTVTQTDGVFKGASEEGFKWLKPNGLPTLGDWFKENAYSTHYFGKCHFAHPKKQSLKRWGFDDWETSFPEPHGTLKNNLGMYRDHGFTDLVTTFLRRKGMALDYDQAVGNIEMTAKDAADEEEQIGAYKKKPWFAVASFTNPHDITTWPVLPGQAEGKEPDPKEPLGIPEKGTMSTPPEQGTWRFDMNPGGISNKYATVPDSWDESLLDKPDCQFDYSLKLGLALAAKTGNPGIANNSAKLTGLPLALASDPKKWTKSYMQYYAYLHHLLDQQIDRVLKTLDETGLRDNTIVVFVPDHGEYGGSHGMMMQKWHTAYQEAIHVPVVVSMPPKCKADKVASKGTPKQIEELTSHIDLAPTLLGLIGVSESEVGQLREGLKTDRKDVPEFVGADLSGLIRGEETKIKDKHNISEDGNRDSILFTTSDMITEPVHGIAETKLSDYHTIQSRSDYDIFLNAVDNYIGNKKNNLTRDQFELTQRMAQGPVVQPAEVHCVREGNWKLVRYRNFHQPHDESQFQWEMYHLGEDAKEVNNLLKYKTTSNETIPQHTSAKLIFTANPFALVNSKLSASIVEEKASRLYDKMLLLIDKMNVEEKR